MTDAELIDKLKRALEDCATDLEAYVTAEYAGTLHYPNMRRKYARDMQSVFNAQKLLELETPK